MGLSKFPERSWNHPKITECKTIPWLLFRLCTRLSVNIIIMEPCTVWCPYQGNVAGKPIWSCPWPVWARIISNMASCRIRLECTWARRRRLPCPKESGAHWVIVTVKKMRKKILSESGWTSLSYWPHFLQYLPETGQSAGFELGSMEEICGIRHGASFRKFVPQTNLSHPTLTRHSLHFILWVLKHLWVPDDQTSLLPSLKDHWTGLLSPTSGADQ